MGKLILSILCCLAIGCASLSEVGRRVEVVNAPPANGHFIGTVMASSPLAGLAFKDPSYANALRKAMNQAGKMGATHLVLPDDSGPRFWGVNQDVRASAYRVEARP
jgi:hypothetical protein